MSTGQVRTIYTHNSNREVADLLQSLFTAELLQPSRSIWLVSPWISDITILDNRSNQFLTLEPNWPQRLITLSDVLLKLMNQQTNVRIITRFSEHTEHFLKNLSKQAGDDHPHLWIRKSANLHIKGLLGDGYFLSGSMNFTHSGITLNDEHVQFTTNPNEVENNRINLETRWGGEAG